MRKPVIIAWRVKCGRVESLDREFWTAAIARMPMFAAAVVPEKFSLGAVAGATFGPSGAGFVLMQILLLAVVGWGINQVASAVGNAQLGSQAKMVTTLVCFVLVIGTVVKALKSFLQVLG
ncbi:MAG: hypothetical protein JL50_02830 [Peptococcaceae bacterium BICA1-7]|nr:MAG: hypothetical protein JL50_02830 [Peptococcaceae bacterium BICA1-7]HBV97801.1 hypothetical protein [Desulfotomaculum sp.]